MWLKEALRFYLEPFVKACITNSNDSVYTI